jgi:hypothetical protein
MTCEGVGFLSFDCGPRSAGLAEAELTWIVQMG